MAVVKIRNTADTGWITVGGGVEILQQDAEPSTTYPGQLWIDTDATAAPMQIVKGYVDRPKFEYKDADEVYIGAGVYHHDGTTERMVYWDSQLTKTVTATTGWNYLYIDDSAIVTAGTDELTASELLFSTTAPTWSSTKHGWYNGLDRCIFATYCGTASTQSIFWHDGSDNISWDTSVVLASGITPSTTWTDVTCRIPTFCDRVDVTVFSIYVNAATYTYWRMDGSSSSGHICGHVNSSKTGEVNSIPNVTTDGGIFEIRWQAAGSNQITIYQIGWYFPRGM